MRLTWGKQSESVDEANFERQLVACIPALKRFALTFSRSKPEAEDLVQSTLERALKKRNQWKGSSPLLHWTFTILRNLWRDSLRGKPIISTALELEGELKVSGSAFESVELEETYKQIMVLPEAQREVLMLVSVQGLTYRETADLLDIPIGTVMSRLARARNFLVNRLGV